MTSCPETGHGGAGTVGLRREALDIKRGATHCRRHIGNARGRAQELVSDPAYRVGQALGSHYVRVDSLVFWWFLVAGLIVGVIGIFKVLRSEGG